ncbi:hypothetical protein EGD00_21120 [Pectobacterium carotovorum subsp. carotovorum]|nr:hypothetical protein EGD00_21120 [Pectobacterium carotovorum subsp. carotovorum]
MLKKTSLDNYFAFSTCQPPRSPYNAPPLTRQQRHAVVVTGKRFTKAVSNDLTLKRIGIVYAARATDEVALLFNNIIRQSVWALTRPYLNDIKSLEE